MTPHQDLGTPWSTYVARAQDERVALVYRSDILFQFMPTVQSMKPFSPPSASWPARCHDGESLRAVEVVAIAWMLVLAAAPAAAQDLARPDPVMTRGAVDSNVTLADICTGTTRSLRHVSPATRAKVMADYNMPAVTTEGIELDHLVPLAIGGSNSAANLWPQPDPNTG